MFKLASLFSVDFVDFQNTDASQAVVCHDDLDTLFDDVSENQQAVTPTLIIHIISYDNGQMTLHSKTTSTRHVLRLWPACMVVCDIANYATEPNSPLRL